MSEPALGRRELSLLEICSLPLNHDVCSCNPSRNITGSGAGKDCSLWWEQQEPRADGGSSRNPGVMCFSPLLMVQKLADAAKSILFPHSHFIFQRPWIWEAPEALLPPALSHRRASFPKKRKAVMKGSNRLGWRRDSMRM